MSGLLPDPVVGSVVVTDVNGNPVGVPPEAGLFSTMGTSFVITGGLSYLQEPVASGSCGGRVTPSQMNFVESELLALAAALSPNFIWTPSSGNNLALALKGADLGGVSTVPVRAATGTTPAATAVADYLVLLNGPSQVNLEKAPPNGTTHVLKDRGSVMSNGSVTITPGSGDTIDGAATLTFTNVGQGATLTYFAGLGWSIY